MLKLGLDFLKFCFGQHPIIEKRCSFRYRFSSLGISIMLSGTPTVEPTTVEPRQLSHPTVELPTLESRHLSLN